MRYQRNKKHGEEKKKHLYKIQLVLHAFALWSNQIHLALAFFFHSTLKNCIEHKFQGCNSPEADSMMAPPNYIPAIFLCCSNLNFGTLVISHW